MAALAACGGDDGQPPLMISKDNAPAVASEVLFGAGQVTNTGGLFSGGGAAFAPTALAALQPRLEELASRVRRAPIQSLDETEACDGGGSIKTSSDGMTSVSIDYQACKQGEVTTNGHMSATAKQSGSSITLSATIDLTVTIGALTLAESGGFDMSVSSSDSSFAFDMTSDHLQVSIKNAGTVLDQITLSNMSMHIGSTTSGSSLTTTVHEKFDIDSTKLTGSFTVETSADLDVKDGSNYATAGSLTITGASGSTLKITVQGDETSTPAAGEGQIKLEVGGDIIWTNWADLQATASTHAGA
ncbi:MAG TPA: hypothetical protein VGC42_25030 [Kofleriaceae bacterium]